MKSIHYTAFRHCPTKIIFHTFSEESPVAFSEESPVAFSEESPVAKRRRTDGWITYIAADGKGVLLPPEIISMLNGDNSFAPAPRSSFKEMLQIVKPGDVITLPSLGQKPKHYGSGYQGFTFVVTEQMEEVWGELAADTMHSIIRLLSGPMGVGKSYLAMFLAAMAYAEAWPLLYISDAAALDQYLSSKTCEEICKRFLALNKDILTSTDLEILVTYVDNTFPVVDACAGQIMGTLLKRHACKTLLVVDEHGVLFNRKSPITPRKNILDSLTNLNWWNQENGTRVVLTGTAHAKFEKKYLRSDMEDCVIFVGPLSQTVFDKLLWLHPELRNPDNAVKVREITNCVPRELVRLVKDHFGDGNSTSFDQKLQDFRNDQRRRFLKDASNYYDFNNLTEMEQTLYRKALSSMFLRSTLGEPTIDFSWQFLDAGLVYRLRENDKVLHKPLCPAALDALLDLYRNCPLPIDMKVASLKGTLSGDDFEDVLFHRLLQFGQVTFDANNIAGKKMAPVHIQFKHFVYLEPKQFTPGPHYAESFVRGYPGYPRFDFMLGRMFIQVSISTFGGHNKKSASIEKAFELPQHKTHKSKEKRNQIERYLDE
ncbi:hypothetical protein BC938DRAFT_482179, partial [Jimgerdemannia flammicorona]